MGTSLTGLTPSTTYDALIKVGDNGALSATAKVLSDGLGNDSALSLSTDKVGIGTSSPSEQLVISNPTLNTTTVLIKNANFPSISSSNSNLRFEQADSFSTTLQLAPSGTFNIATHGVVYPVQIKGTLSVNTSTPLTATVGIKGSGTTSATTSLLVQNSAGTLALSVTNDGQMTVISSNVYADILLGNGSAANTGIKSTGYTVFLTSNASSIASWNYQTYFNASKLAVGGTVGSMTPNASSVLDCQSTVGGFLPPRMTTAQKNAIATPAAGLMVYDTTLAKLCVYTTAWETITSV
jgi:hypothetical protein